MPAKGRVGRNDAGDLIAGGATEPVADRRQRDALRIGKTHASVYLISKDTVLGDEAATC